MAEKVKHMQYTQSSSLGFSSIQPLYMIPTRKKKEKKPLQVSAEAVVFGYYGNHQLVRFGAKDVEGERWRKGGRSQKMSESWMLGALCIAMFHCWERGRSSQDLNVSIIHEVVLRYANMNYLTSRADLLLSVYLRTSPHSLLSVLTLWLRIWISSQSSVSFLEPSSPNYLGLSGFLSLPLCLSALSASAPL